MTEKITPAEKDKKSFERSASYPGFTIEYILNFIGGVSKNFPTNQVLTAGDISAVTKVKTVHRIIAAALQYGLLVKAKNGYQISQAYMDYINPVSPDERKNLLLSFFKSPKLYSDLIEKFNSHVLPPEFKSILIRFHKIAQGAVDEVAGIFIKNAEFVGVLNGANILDVSVQSNINEAINTADDSKVEPLIAPKPEQHTTESAIRLLEQFGGQEDIKIVLTESKYCFIKYPKNINEKDVLILKKWIELLELTVQ